MKFRLAILLVGLIVIAPSCQTGTVTRGVPNYVIVDDKALVTRGGQPQDVAYPDGWHLIGMIATNVVKLNPASESSDAGALAVGLRVQSFPISFEQQMFGTGLDDVVRKAVAAITPKTYVHCAHGQDRTGLVIAVYRVQVQHWSKADAEKEMLARGFHKELRGLWEYWEGFRP